MSIFSSGRMRFNTTKIPTKDRNRMVQDPKLLEKLEKYINNVKAETTYFFEASGNRVASFIVHIESASQIPVCLKPLSVKWVW